MSTNDVPGAKSANLDTLAMGCWAESPDGSLLFVSSAENGRIIYSMFDLRPDDSVVEYRDAMPQKDFEVAFTWRADKSKASGKAQSVPDIRWTWHDKTPFPWDRVIKQGAKDGLRHASAADLLSDAEKVRQSINRRRTQGETIVDMMEEFDAEDGADGIRPQVAVGGETRLGDSDAERVASALGALAEQFEPEKVQHLVATFGKSMRRIGRALERLGR